MRKPRWEVWQQPRLETEQIDTNTLLFRVRGGVDKSVRQQVVLALRRMKKVTVNGTVLNKTQAVKVIMELLRSQNSATVSF